MFSLFLSWFLSSNVPRLSQSHISRYDTVVSLKIYPCQLVSQSVRQSHSQSENFSKVFHESRGSQERPPYWGPADEVYFLKVYFQKVYFPKPYFPYFDIFNQSDDETWPDQKNLDYTFRPPHFAFHDFFLFNWEEVIWTQNKLTQNFPGPSFVDPKHVHDTIVSSKLCEFIFIRKSPFVVFLKRLILFVFFTKDWLFFCSC